jgi:hypothetical protein
MKAVVKNGLFVPREPLPGDWPEGTEVEVHKLGQAADSTDVLDRWYADLEAIAAQGDPEDDRRLEEALRKIRQQAKEQGARQVRIPE